MKSIEIIIYWLDSTRTQTPDLSNARPRSTDLTTEPGAPDWGDRGSIMILDDVMPDNPDIIPLSHIILLQDKAVLALSQ